MTTACPNAPQTRRMALTASLRATLASPSFNCTGGGEIKSQDELHSSPRVRFLRIKIRAIWSPIYRGSALSQSEFDREAVLILHSDSDMLRLWLIGRGWTPCAVRGRDELSYAVDLGQRRRVDWASLGRPVACRARHAGNRWAAWWAGWLGRTGGLVGFQPIRLGNIENLLSYSKSFINFKSILISNQIWISMTSTHTIKYRSTPPPNKNMHRHEMWHP
jgi:hypothetical protein